MGTKRKSGLLLNELNLSDAHIRPDWAGLGCDALSCCAGDQSSFNGGGNSDSGDFWPLWNVRPHLKERGDLDKKTGKAHVPLLA